MSDETDLAGTRRAAWITIIRGSAGAAVAWALIWFVVPHVSAMQTRSEVNATRVTMSALSGALEEYFTDHRGQYPSERVNLAALVNQPKIHGNQWQGPYLDRVPRDAWGNTFLYLCPGVRNSGGFDLTSAGPDCVLGNADDITN